MSRPYFDPGDPRHPGFPPARGLSMMGDTETRAAMPAWASLVPGAFALPVQDLGGLPAVYVLGRGRRTFHVGQAQNVAERAFRYNALWRSQSLHMATWALVWPVPLRDVTRTEAAVQTWLLPERDDPKTVELKAHHVQHLRAMGLEERAVWAVYRSRWAAYLRRTGQPYRPPRRYAR